MRKIITILLLFLFTNLYCQDFIRLTVYPAGSEIKYEICINKRKKVTTCEFLAHNGYKKNCLHKKRDLSNLMSLIDDLEHSSILSQEKEFSFGTWVYKLEVENQIFFWVDTGDIDRNKKINNPKIILIEQIINEIIELSPKKIELKGHS